MLARLQRVEGIAHAAVDYGGNYMQLTAAVPSALERATARLRELGYEPEVVAAGASTPSRWYDVDSVHELSAVEAQVIAGRVVRKFNVGDVLQRDAADRLQGAVAAALDECFKAWDASADVTPGQFREDCLRSAAAAARAILSDDTVAAFVSALADDLNEDHTHDAGL